MLNMILKPEHEAFLDGYKPSILIGNDSEFISELEHYPSVLMDRNRDYISSLFFYTEEAKQAYLEKIIDIEQDSYEDHYLLGITLGFPEKSVDFSARMRVYKAQTGEPSKEERYAVGLIWAGFSFSTHMDYVSEEATWMWDTYKHPKSVEFPLYLCPSGNEILEVPYGDKTRLAEAYEQIYQLVK